MTTVLNIRGTNGSGKSTAALSLLADPVTTRIAGVECLSDGLTVLIGPYPPGKTGGCDRVKTFDIMRRTIAAAIDIGFERVVFEGITVSTVFGSWAEFCYYRPFWWVYLDTPVDVCLARVRARNGGAPFNEKMVRDKFTAIANTRTKAIAARFPVYDINWKEDIYGQLQAITLLD